MTIRLLYPCGKPCSRETHNGTVKRLTVFSAFIKGIMMESRLRISISWEYFQFTFAVTIVVHKSHNLIGTLGSSEFGPSSSRVRFFRVML